MRSEPPSAEQLQWEKTVSRAITSDVIWKLDAYRSAMYLLHVARRDCTRIYKAHPNEKVAAQLADAAGSVSAAIGEGYGRVTRLDRLRFLGYALGSVRECTTWYVAADDVLEAQTLEARLELIARNRALLLGLIRSIRKRAGPGGDIQI